MRKIQDFESFLIEEWQNEVRFTGDDCLDDDAPDVFSKWLCDLQPDDFIKYGNKYAIYVLDWSKELIAQGGK